MPLLLSSKILACFDTWSVVDKGARPVKIPTQKSPKIFFEVDDPVQHLVTTEVQACGRQKLGRIVQSSPRETFWGFLGWEF